MDGNLLGARQFRRKEWEQQPEQRIRAQDADRNGKLTRREMPKAPKAKPSPAPG